MSGRRTIEPCLEGAQHFGQVRILPHVLHAAVAHRVGALPFPRARRHCEEILQVEGDEAGRAQKVRGCADARAAERVLQRHNGRADGQIVVAAAHLVRHTVSNF